jgi:hypothetical protein
MCYVDVVEASGVIPPASIGHESKPEIDFDAEPSQSR